MKLIGYISLSGKKGIMWNLAGRGGTALMKINFDHKMVQMAEDLNSGLAAPHVK